MNCPFCGKEMWEGAVPAQQSALRWTGRGPGEDGEPESVLLAKTPWFTNQEAQAFYCPDCRQVVIPVPELEPVSSRLKRKLDAARDRAEQAREDWETRQAEKKETNKWNRRRGKDPWEW